MCRQHVAILVAAAISRRLHGRPPHTHTLEGPPWALLALVVKRPHLLKLRKSCVDRFLLHSYRGFPRLSIYEYSYRGFPRLNIYECGSRHPPFSLAVFWRGTGATANLV